MTQKKQELRSALVEHFTGGVSAERRLGVEIEHFVVEKESGMALPFAGGVDEIVEELAGCYPHTPEKEGDTLLGFDTADFNITLEPAAQLEISIAPRESIAEIAEIYRGFRERLLPILEKRGAALVALGYQPKARVDELTLIPKERYRLMDAHFAHTGDHHGGREMMRGTASTQISIDYASEKDFREKLQAVSFLLPVIAMFADNTPFFEGKPFSGHLKRTDIWRRTDPARCGLLPGVFRADYGFADYADYLCRMPLILYHKGDVTFSTGLQTAEEVYKDRPIDIDKEDIRHVLSMAFPDVRLKNYLEIRVADSLPLTEVLAYCAFLKGLLYSDEGLRYCLDFIQVHQASEETVHRAEDALMEKGWAAEIYGMPAAALAEKLLELAKSALSAEEGALLDCWRKKFKG